MCNLTFFSGKNFEKVCEMCEITLNKSAIFGDNGAISPGGVRIGMQFIVLIQLMGSVSGFWFLFVTFSGTPAMTSRGCLETDFDTIADFLLRAAQIACSVQREHGKLQKDFIKGLQNNKDVTDLRVRVETFASQFAMPAFDN